VLDDGTSVDARPSDALVLAAAADLAIEIDAALLAADRKGPPNGYVEDLARSEHGATQLAGKLRAHMSAMVEEVLGSLARGNRRDGCPAVAVSGPIRGDVAARSRCSTSPTTRARPSWFAPGRRGQDSRRRRVARAPPLSMESASGAVDRS
jgi:hypothetical protein